MQNLHVLTNNNLGDIFWEQRTGLVGAVKIQDLSPNTFQSLLQQKAGLILIDFYFSKLSFDVEKGLINRFKELAEISEESFKLFILSPFFSSTKMEEYVDEHKMIVAHNFSIPFLRSLLLAGLNNDIKS